MLGDILQSGRSVPAHRPWPRAIVDPAGWDSAAFLAADGRCTLLGLWGEADAVHMLHGIEHKSDPGAPATGDVSARIDKRMPFQWHEAIATLRKARILPDYLGAEYLALYADSKAAELTKFNNAISPREHEWYL